MWVQSLKIIAVVLLLPIVVEASNPNGWSGLQKPTFWNNWSVGLNAGLTSYYGDLSYYDDNFMEKLAKESGVAVDVNLTRHFFDRFGVTGQILYGGFQSNYNEALSFETNFIEYNLHARWHVISTLAPYSQSPFDVDLYAGIGQFIFKSSQYKLIEGEQQTLINNTGIPEFVYFFGGSASYQISDSWNIIASLSIRQAQNDKLDNLIKNDNFDYYSTISVGVSYSIENLLKPFHVSNSKFYEGMRLTKRR